MNIANTARGHKLRVWAAPTPSICDRGQYKWLIIAGLVLIALGLIVWFFTKASIPLGQLPGDIHYKSDKVQVYFPIGTCIFISLLLSLLFWLFKK